MGKNSLWNRLWASIGGTESANDTVQDVPFDAARYAFIDAEVGAKDKKLHDIGALRNDGAIYHGCSRDELRGFLTGVHYVCGHNIIHHDVKYLFGDASLPWRLVDTLYMSPLLFPQRPYHRLLKDDKLLTEQMNNPVCDCGKARDLLMDEITQWRTLSAEKQQLYTTLLRGQAEFDGFLDMTGMGREAMDATSLIRQLYAGKICQYADIRNLVRQHPVALAYALALIDTTDHRSITPRWVLYNYPSVEWIVHQLRHTPCSEGCDYCRRVLDVHHNLKTFFGYDEFRTYDGEPLQERAAQAAVEGKSLLAIFPTGGGKSLTFQLPALMAGHSVHGLTVVISPLQSLMKDQVDNLAERGIADAVTINGMLDPITRSLAIKRVMNGDASLLYIAPKMLRSTTIQRILLARHVVRFVIDEAHCFSSWGHDFRVDYLYIGRFIREYQEKKANGQHIPVSCFTATAKQKVVQDICDYFKQELGLELELFASTATRTNLHYRVIYVETDDEKYQRLRSLVAESTCPTIVYVSRTKRAVELAQRLTRDGLRALPFHGQMDADDKVSNQDAFMTGRVQTIVATSAFGMGVDKKDVGLVVHYDISDSLENYVQEAGRAGRDPSLDARCYVLYSDSDLDKHFILLNQTKLSISEIQQVWRAVKQFTRQRPTACCSALEIARQAGWDDTVSDIETRVRTALAALEQGGYLERGTNVPHVFATGITVKNVDEARERIMRSTLFGQDDVEKAVRIIKSLITHKAIVKAQDAEAESRVDYLADMLGLSRFEVVSVVERMRQEGILADSKDISAFLMDADCSQRKALKRLGECARLEEYLLKRVSNEVLHTSSKQLNDEATKAGIDTARERDIRTLLYFLTVKGYIRKQGTAAMGMEITWQADAATMQMRQEQRLAICRFAVDWLYGMVSSTGKEETQRQSVQFSVVELLKQFKESQMLHTAVQLEDVEEALLYLANIGALKLEGGFLVLYNATQIRRLKENKYRYRVDDYRMLDEFYKQKMQQVHIVGEYANLMVSDYQAAMQFVQDYFQIDYKQFVSKYFKGERFSEIQRNLTPQKYDQLFGQLSERQMDIIKDKESRCIVVAAGPGSGKTRVLVHKLASLLLLEDVKHEQLLMLTFSRAAATEFKQRLMELIGNAAHFVEIKTFHSCCFDLLGRIGSLDEAKDVVERAATMINSGEVEPSRIGKTVLVIDEAQDMSQHEYDLVKALMAHNEEMRVIAVGDDDQNIYEFRHSNSNYMFALAQGEGCKCVEMTENYRNARHVVNYANAFAKHIGQRWKKTPIVAMRPDEGCTEVVHYSTKNMYQPLADSITCKPRNGSTCVLTRTNEEAAIMNALLRQRCIKSKLIQSADGFRFGNMAEVRYFMKRIKEHVVSPLIPDKLWEEAKLATQAKYEHSTSLVYLQRMVKVFEQTNKEKYVNDLREFVFESSLEDFVDTSDAEVVVSTIHKAKGREFDNVYMLLAAGQMQMDNSAMRSLYVGITRAKNNLFIHTNEPFFLQLQADRHVVDPKEYTLPNEVMLQQSMHDVNLQFCKGRKKEILALRGGDRLEYKDYVLYDTVVCRSVSKLSASMVEQLTVWLQRGYEVSSANVRFIVAWRPKDAPKDEVYAVLLTDLMLRRIEQ